MSRVLASNELLDGFTPKHQPSANLLFSIRLSQAEQVSKPNSGTCHPGGELNSSIHSRPSPDWVMEGDGARQGASTRFTVYLPSCLTSFMIHKPPLTAFMGPNIYVS